MAKAKSAKVTKVPKFKKAWQAAEWIADKINKKTWTTGTLFEKFKSAIVDDEELGDYDDRNIPKNYQPALEGPNPDRFCALGWITVANNKHEKKLKEELAAYLEPSIEEDGSDVYPEDVIPEWNDDNKRKWTDIRTAFRRVAKRLREAKV